MQKTFLCLNKNKNIIPTDVKEFDAWLDKMPEKLSVSVGPFKNQRSIQQNKAYFKLAVEIIADSLGYEKDEIHSALAETFLGFEEKNVNGVNIRKRISTADLKTDEFSKYFQRIQIWASGMNIIIPDPEKVN